MLCKEGIDHLPFSQEFPEKPSKQTHWNNKSSAGTGLHIPLLTHEMLEPAGERKLILSDNEIRRCWSRMMKALEAFQKLRKNNCAWLSMIG